MTVVDVHCEGGPMHGHQRSVQLPFDVLASGALPNIQPHAMECVIFTREEEPPIRLLYILDFGEQNRWRFFEGLPLVMICHGEVR